MSSFASEGTSAFGSSRTGTVTTITSDHTNKRTNKSNRYSLLQLRSSHHQPASNSSQDNVSLGNASADSGSTAHRQSRLFQNGIKFLDHHLRPESRQQLSVSRTPASRRSQSPVPKTSTSTLTSLHASTASDGSISRDNVSSPAGSLTSSSTYVPMTKGEFESLPPTIQRKYFSTLERLRFAQDSSNIDIEDALATSAASLDALPRPYNTPPITSASNGNSSPQNTQHTRRLTLQSQLPSESVNAVVPQRTRSALARQRSSSAARPSPYRGEENHSSAQPWRQSVILDATDEAFIKRGKRQTIAVGPRSSSLNRPASADHLSLKMHPRPNDQTLVDGRLKETENSLLDSFKWLEDDGDLDLRLNLDDYHVGLRQDAKSHRKSHSSSFRRNLSISSKLAFGRPSSNLSHPSTRDETTTPPPFGGSVTSLQNPSGHVRRRSRALSLMSAPKQPVPVAETPASPQSMDPAAHYQDPDARMKLRVYLGSPHKFDEAVEFGFPSTEQSPTTTQQPVPTPPRVDSLQRNAERTPLRMQTLVEDKRCSLYSDGATASESDSPRTPDTLEKPTPPEVPQEQSEEPEMPTPKVPTPKVDYAQAPASSREMTLRMTLTRPDLRANEDQLYGWQKARPVTQEGRASDGPRSPTTFKTDDELKKDSIERELAAIDQENVLSQERGTMKRFWNRVRRV